MRISSLSQVDAKELLGLEYDICLVACGYESRATHAVNEINPKSGIKLLLAFEDRKDGATRKASEAFFRDREYEIIPMAGHDDAGILSLLANRYYTLVKGATIRLLVDYSVMTKSWYAAVLNWLAELPEQRHSVVVDFVYSLPEYYAPTQDPAPNLYVEPVQSSIVLSSTMDRTGLVIGLGSIGERAEGLLEYIDAVPYVFHSSADTEYGKLALEKNSRLLDRVPEENIIERPVEDMHGTFVQLYDLCRSLSTKGRVVIAPCGPKPFALISLIVAALLERVEVWRITGASQDEATDKKAVGLILAFRVTWGA